MHYGEIKNYDIANGVGVRVSLFVSGCTNHCEHCFQPQTWDFCYGKEFTPEVPFVAGVRERYPKKTIWAFSGFTYEELTTDGTHAHCEITEELLSLIDVLVDGRFVEAKKDISLRFRGSSNQRIIDLRKTRETNSVVLWDEK